MILGSIRSLCGPAGAEPEASIMNRLLRHLLPFLWIAAASPVAAQSTGFDIEGRYDVLQPPQLTETGDRIEVVEVFWYGCPHCYTFLPYMESYDELKPEYVEVRRMPAIFRDTWDAHARAYYTAMLLGVTDRTHRPLFEEIHEHGKPTDDKETLAAFFERHGVDRAEFEKTYDSFAVESLVRKSVVMQKRYGVTGTPSVVVNGKYRVSGQGAGGHEGVIAVVAELVERERSVPARATVAAAQTDAGTARTGQQQAQSESPTGGDAQETRAPVDQSAESVVTVAQSEDSSTEAAAQSTPKPAETAAVPASSSILQPWQWVVIGIVALLLMALGGMYARRRRRHDGIRA